MFQFLTKNTEEKNKVRACLRRALEEAEFSLNSAKYFGELAKIRGELVQEMLRATETIHAEKPTPETQILLDQLSSLVRDFLETERNRTMID